MGLIQKFVSVFISPYNIKHYQNLGYKCKNNDIIEVKISDLSKGSGIKIDVQCDYCGVMFQQAYRRFLEHPNDIACKKCRYHKVAKTNIERYGNPCSLRNEDVNKKVVETSMKKYGVPMPILSKQSIAKAKATKIKRYGVPYPFQNKEILHKCYETYKNNRGIDMIPISKNQYLLHDLYGGILNYPISNKYVDILLDDNVCCEYDGGGHRMNVIRGRMTDEEFDIKERKRENEIIDCGYKIFRIVSRRDKLFNNNKMLEIKNIAYQKLIDNDVFIFDIDNNSEKSYKM